MGTIVDSPKNETCKTIKLGSEVVIMEYSPSLVIKEEIINKIEEVDETLDVEEEVEVEKEKEVSEKMSEYYVRRDTLDN